MIYKWPQKIPVQYLELRYSKELEKDLRLFDKPVVQECAMMKLWTCVVRKPTDEAGIQG